MALGSGDRDLTREHLREALAVASGFRLNPALTAILLTVAQLVAENGAVERAAELLSLVERHPASLDYSRRQARQQLEELKGQLAPDSFAAAVERGQALDLGTTVVRLLEELL